MDMVGYARPYPLPTGLARKSGVPPYGPIGRGFWPGLWGRVVSKFLWVPQPSLEPSEYMIWFLSDS